MGNPRTFHYLNQSNWYELDGLDESEEYAATRRAMDVVGISFEEQVSLQVISYRNNKFFKGEVSLKFVIFNLWFFTQEAIVRVLSANTPSRKY